MADVRLQEMTDDEYTRWARASQAGYAESWVSNGTLTEEEAAAKASSDFAGLLPDGRQTAGQYLWTAVDAASSSPVGVLWVNVAPRGDGKRAFVYDIEIDETQRGRGYGRATMVAGEAAVRELGASTIGLNVFGFNTTAIRLYESLGYEVTTQQMQKSLGGQGAAGQNASDDELLTGSEGDPR